MSDVMSNLSPVEAVARLTARWEDVLSPAETGSDGYRTVVYDALLDMLADACRTSVSESGAGAGGDVSARSLLNLEALGLQNRIEGSVKSWIENLSKRRPPKELKAAVVQLAGLLQAGHASKSIPVNEFERVSAFFPRWAEQIWLLYDPPTMREVQQPCPRCLVEWLPGVDGSQRAVWITYRGSLVNATARCRACGVTWDSLPAMREIGITIDRKVSAA